MTPPHPEPGWTPSKYVSQFTAKLQGEEKKYGPAMNCGCNSPGWEAPGNEMIWSLKRFRMGKSHRCICCNLPPGLIEDGLHILGRLQPGSVAASILSQYKHLRSMKPKACQHGVMAMCKIMTGLMKMGGPFIHPHWRQLCYWELQYGYVPYKQMDSMKQEVEEWLCHRNSLGGPLGEDEYMDELYHATQQFMSEEWKVPKKVQSGEICGYCHT